MGIFDRIDERPPDDLTPPLGLQNKDKLRQQLAEAVANTGGVAAKPERADEDRRFTDKPDLDPGAVRSLSNDHPALKENRTLFPSTVVDVTEEFEDRLLVSGKNNRKLGERIAKGKFKGYALYGLSLEERATCPTDCTARGFCYGNGMQMARRHRITDLDLFNAFLEDEIRTILADPIDGLMVRLHVLGDFPSVEYVAMWADLLEEHERLACYGYTHRRVSKNGGDDIGDAIEALKARYPSRFRIRWSGDKPQPDGSTIINFVPDKKRVEQGLVCPAQTDATACCATCGLCWEGANKHDTIAFIKHGPKSLSALAASMQPAEPEEESDTPANTESVRAVTALTIPQKRDPVLSTTPELRIVSPTDLRIEGIYQRDLSGKSLKLIRKIVTGWDWTKFKPPICAETEHGLFIIDGQHTAIAAASHPEIRRIPVMIVPAAHLTRRAEAFVAHNRDRLIMSPFQIFHAEAAAGNKAARDVLAIAERCAVTIPRAQPLKGYAKAGQVLAIADLRNILFADGAEILERILRIAGMTKLAPVSRTVTRALRMICKESTFADTARLKDSHIANAVRSIKDIDAAAQAAGVETGQSRDRACAAMIVEACKQQLSGVAA